MGVVRCADGAEETARITAWARAVPRGQTRAVLARMNAQLAPVEQALLGAGVRAVVVGAAAFAERAGIRDALAALTLASNPRDRLAFTRVATAAGRGVGPGTCRALFAQADAHPERSLLAHGADADDPGPHAPARRPHCGTSADRSWPPRTTSRPDRSASPTRSSPSSSPPASPTACTGRPAAQPRGPTRTARRAAAAQPARARPPRPRLRAARRAPDLGDLLADLALDRDARHADPDAVVLSTIHRAKGLEFDHVWLAGAEEGRLPHRRALAEDAEPEERRLAYVAVTRARRTLHVSWAASARPGAARAVALSRGHRTHGRRAMSAYDRLVAAPRTIVLLDTDGIDAGLLAAAGLEPGRPVVAEVTGEGLLLRAATAAELAAAAPVEAAEVKAVLRRYPATINRLGR